MMSPFSTRSPTLHQRLLVDAGRLVRALELHQPVDVDAGLGRVGLLGRAHDDAGRVDLVDDAGAARGDRRARIARDDRLHAGADERRVRAHAAARPGAACSSPSARGWRRRSRGTGSAPRRPRRAASARRPCSRRGRPRETRRRRRGGRRSRSPDQAAAARRSACRPGRPVFLLLHRRQIDDLVGHLAVAHPAVGRSMKPYLLTRAKVASELMRPMFGPSGVSIGQMRP